MGLSRLSLATILASAKIAVLGEVVGAASKVALLIQMNREYYRARTSIERISGERCHTWCPQRAGQMASGDTDPLAANLRLATVPSDGTEMDLLSSWFSPAVERLLVLPDTLNLGIPYPNLAGMAPF
jgi:hypothetical protein